MKFVEDHIGANKDIPCPCNHCLNVLHKSQDVVLAHLMINGMDVGYTKWVYHGEIYNLSVDDPCIVVDNAADADSDEEDNLFDLLEEHQNLINNEVEVDGHFRRIMAPGYSKKGQATIPFNVSKASASSIPRRMSILDEPMSKKVGAMTSTSLAQGKKELAFLKSTSLSRIQTLLSARGDPSHETPAHVSGNQETPTTVPSTDVPNVHSTHGASNSPTSSEASLEIRTGGTVAAKDLDLFWLAA
ncbi:hypothetical protein LINPERHAP1_LOCUS9154 [Linum perenne]